MRSSSPSSDSKLHAEMEELSDIALAALKRAQDEARVLYARYGLELVVSKEAPAKETPRPKARVKKSPAVAK